MKLMLLFKKIKNLRKINKNSKIPEGQDMGRVGGWPNPVGEPASGGAFFVHDRLGVGGSENLVGEPAYPPTIIVKCRVYLLIEVAYDKAPLEAKWKRSACKGEGSFVRNWCGSFECVLRMRAPKISKLGMLI